VRFHGEPAQEDEVQEAAEGPGVIRVRAMQRRAGLGSAQAGPRGAAPEGRRVAGPDHPLLRARAPAAGAPPLHEPPRDLAAPLPRRAGAQRP
jgi:hypothetical protein